jgi:uncharacterized membrane protein YesL
MEETMITITAKLIGAFMAACGVVLIVEMLYAISVGAPTWERVERTGVVLGSALLIVVGVLILELT